MDKPMYPQKDLDDLHRQNRELVVKCLVLLKAVEENPGLLTRERVDELRRLKARIEANREYIIQIDFHLGKNNRLSNLN